MEKTNWKHRRHHPHKQERQASKGRQRDQDRQAVRSQHVSQAVNKDLARARHHHLQKDEPPCVLITLSSTVQQRGVLAVSPVHVIPRMWSAWVKHQKKIPDGEHIVFRAQPQTCSAMTGAKTAWTLVQTKGLPKFAPTGPMGKINPNFSSEGIPPRSNPNNTTEPFSCKDLIRVFSDV